MTGQRGLEAEEARVEDVLRNVLEREEFQAREESGSVLGEWLGRLFRSSPDSDLATPMAYVFGGLIAAVLCVALWRVLAAGRWKRAGPSKNAGGARSRSAEGAPSSRDRVVAYLTEAASAREAGDLQKAVRYYFTALVVGLGSAGSLEYRDSWTHREILARGRPKSPWDARLSGLADRLEALSFGGRETASSDVDELRSMCADVFGESAL